MAQAHRVSPAASRPETDEATLPAAPLGFLAARLTRLALEAGEAGLILVASSERRAEQVARLAARLAPDLAVILLPPWDCLPYDRASPSRLAMGRRMAALRALAAATGPRLAVTTPDAILQRLPPPAAAAENVLRFATGDAIDPAAIGAALTRIGYVLDERVDEPGEAAIRGRVVEIFPAAGDMPFRLEHEDGVITAIRSYDPVSQRTSAEVEALEVEPASEVVTSGEDEAPERGPGHEHRLPDFHERLVSLFDLMPDAALAEEPRAATRRMGAFEQIADSHEARRASRDGIAALAPHRLYLDAAAWDASVAARPVVPLVATGEEAAVPAFVAQRSAARTFADFVAAQRAAGRRVLLAGARGRDVSAMAERLRRLGDAIVENVENWAQALAAPSGAVLRMTLPLDEGFVDAEAGVAVVAAPDLLGSRAESIAETAPMAAELLLGGVGFQIGDVVVHLDHGLAILRGIETVETPGAGPEDAIRLEFAGGDVLMVPADDLDRIWRYGSDPDAVRLDRLGGEAWVKKRAELEADLTERAAQLAKAARQRAKAKAPPITPPRRDYERFAARFPFAETADQASAIRAVLDDLASGRPMDRLVCGDVGFGKTEVALRAAAAAALAGRQVAVVAPTTVLVRQHIETFRRRFAGFGIEVAQLSRLVSPAEAKAVKAGLADGSVRVVVGTHAVAAKGVSFADLGLVIIDEEQRFGAADKARLRALAKNVNVLTLTATPIPRTLQASLIGLQEMSVIATPPARRQPVRTFLSTFDDVTAREALLRERARGGQSFVVCPRIEDIGPMAERLAALVPELGVVTAHGKMPVAALDDAMVRFADGEGDVLLATNIIESGLDVPRANTMLVWHADRFGLAQLHQLRGRVGRGRPRGICYLLTEGELAPATRKRLETLTALDRLGAGFALSARDLDLRGAGDLFSEDQAGHVTLVGVGLYRHLLDRALRAARGEAVEDWRPELNLGAAGAIPPDWVPEPEVRIDLHARLARLDSDEAIDALAEEIEDRFGAPPEAVAALFDRMRIVRLCARLGVARVDAGPQAIALRLREHAPALPAAAGLAQTDGAEWRGDRLVIPGDMPDEGDRRARVLGLLRELEAG